MHASTVHLHIFRLQTHVQVITKPLQLMLLRGHAGRHDMQRFRCKHCRSVDRGRCSDFNATEWTSQDGEPQPRSCTRSKSENSMALRFLLLLRSVLMNIVAPSFCAIRFFRQVSPYSKRLL